MKKTLIALAVAVSAVSGAAHAWTTGDFDGSFDINGTITAEQYNDKWEWMTGNGLSFENTIKQMSDDNTKLTITQDSPAPILLGRTKEAFAAPSVGVGAIPLISFTDYAGEPVSLQNADGENKGFFNLPMKDNLGNVKVNVTSAALLSKSDTPAGQVRISSLTSTSDSNIYYGGLVSSVVGTGSAASSLVGKFGGDNHSALLSKIKQVIPDAGSKGQMNWIYAGTTDMVDTKSEVMASSYALGIDAGQTIEAKFTNPVVSTTQWSAPLNVEVAYN
ncbi:fimbrial protein [Escherichia coli]|uniref:F4 family fimbrial subunit n=1 Tax=Escherichia coli TaxID=562 RepID=UPI00215A12AF|nr:fimbrial protein [Escherichia coli]